MRKSISKFGINVDKKETDQSRYMRVDDVRNLDCSNFHTE